MKKIMFMLAAVLFVSVLTGCTTYYRDSGADLLYRPPIIQGAPYYTEYEVSQERISATGEASVLFGIFQFAENKKCLTVRDPELSVFSILKDLISPTQRAVDNARSVARYNACEKSNADQLLGVTCDYKIVDYMFFAKVDCIVRGFPAKVKAVRMMNKKPVILNKWQKVEYLAPHEIPAVYSGDKTPELKFMDSFK